MEEAQGMPPTNDQPMNNSPFTSSTHAKDVDPENAMPSINTNDARASQAGSVDQPIPIKPPTESIISDSSVNPDSHEASKSTISEPPIIEPIEKGELPNILLHVEGHIHEEFTRMLFISVFK